MDQQNCQRQKKESHEGVRLGTIRTLFILFF